MAAAKAEAQRAEAAEAARAETERAEAAKAEAAEAAQAETARAESAKAEAAQAQAEAAEAEAARAAQAEIARAAAAWADAAWLKIAKAEVAKAVIGNAKENAEVVEAAAPVGLPRVEALATAEIEKSVDPTQERPQDHDQNVKAVSPAVRRPRLKVVARPEFWKRPAKAHAALVHERLTGSGDRARPPAPAVPPPVEAAASHRSRRAKTISSAGAKRLLAVTAAITLTALAIMATVVFDPWASKDCPKAADQGADCVRFGLAGRTYSALALVKVVKELESSQWAPALGDLKPILRIRPNYALALGDRGEAEAELGYKTAALADYDRALTLAPHYLPTRAQRGQLYQSMGKTKEAAADFAFIYHVDPSTYRWAEVIAFVRRIDHSTPAPKVHRRPKHRQPAPSVDAAPPSVQTSTQTPEQPPQPSPSEEN